MLVSIPYWEWDKCGRDHRQKQAYLRSLLVIDESNEKIKVDEKVNEQVKVEPKIEGGQMVKVEPKIEGGQKVKVEELD